MNDAYLRKLIALAEEVGNVFGYGTINPRSLKSEVDMDQLGKLWQLIGYIMALKNENKMNGYTPPSQQEEAKEQNIELPNPNQGEEIEKAG